MVDVAETIEIVVVTGLLDVLDGNIRDRTSIVNVPWMLSDQSLDDTWH